MQDQQRRLHIATLLSLPVLLGVLLAAPLTASFWLDETLSVWVSQGSLAEVSAKALQFQGQSPFYFFLLGQWQNFFGDSELALRALSLLFFLGAAIYCYRITACIIGREYAGLCLVPFFLHEQIILAGIEARPYSLALFCALGSISHYIAAVERNSRADTALFIFFLVLAFYAHYLFLSALFVHFLYACIYRTDKQGLKILLFGLPFILLFLLPARSHLSSLFARSSQLSFANIPGAIDLVSASIPVSFAVYLVLALVLPWSFLRAEFCTSAVNRRALLFVLAWMLLPPLFFFLHAQFGSGSLFVSRYFLWSAPACVILSALALSSFEGQRAKVFGLLIFAVFGVIQEFSRDWHIEDWRSAVAALSDQVSSKRDKVYAYTGLIELESLDQRQAAANQPYLTAPLRVYGYLNSVQLLPSEKNYFPYGLESFWILALNKLRMGQNGELQSVVEGYKTALKTDGYRVQSRQQFGEVWLLQVLPPQQASESTTITQD